MKLGTIAELFMLLGAILIGVAGFTISLTVGLAVTGVLLIVFGVVLFFVHLSDVRDTINKRGGG